MISHDRTADLSNENLGCNDFFGQGSKNRQEKRPELQAQNSMQAACMMAVKGRERERERKSLRGACPINPLSAI